VRGSGYMDIGRVTLVVTISVLAAACSRERGLRCEPDERYAASATAPPLQIPEDLTVPDETDALRIPDRRPDPESETSPEQPCLESPPDFFEEGQDEE
jgi:uncharacterized lipoprotein